MISIQDLRGSKCTDDEWTEYCQMPQIRSNETPNKWKERIWARLTYFRENDLLPIESKKYFNARKLIRFPDGSSYAPTIGIAICLSCNELVYTGKSIKTIESHWKSACTGNKYCELKYEDYLKIKHKPESNRTFDDTRALHYYELWVSNAIRRLKRAREIGKKIQACIKIQRKIVEWIYRPDGFNAHKLALHYACLQNIRAEMHQMRQSLEASLLSNIT